VVHDADARLTVAFERDVPEGVLTFDLATWEL
jgi:hypothetical protein